MLLWRCDVSIVIGTLKMRRNILFLKSNCVGDSSFPSSLKMGVVQNDPLVYPLMEMTKLVRGGLIGILLASSSLLGSDTMDRKE